MTTYSGYVEGTSTEHIFAHSENNQFSAQVSFKVKKGNYYMIICPGWQDTNYGGAFSFKAVFPSDESARVNSDSSDTAGGIMYLSTVMEEGDTLKLAAVTSGNAKASYGTSNKNVASVDAYGKIKAKSEGSAYITIKCGKTVIKIKVTVVSD